MSSMVKYINSAMQGAPVVTNAWGDITALLTAVLNTGFNNKAITGIARVGSVVTATLSSGHGFIPDQVILFAGADQADYNGEKRLLSVTATTVVYDIGVATPATPATTSTALSMKVAPLGFDVAYSATNKAVYRSPNVLSNRPYLRVDNSLDPLYTTTYAKWAKVTMAEGMSGIDTFVGKRAPYDPALPTKNEIATGSGSAVINGWYKWYQSYLSANVAASTADTNTEAKQWLIVGDDRGFYFHIHFSLASAGYGRCGYAFTDFKSLKAGDAYNTILVASEKYNAASAAQMNYTQEASELYTQNSYTGKVVMADYTQLGNPIRLAPVSNTYGVTPSSPSGTQAVIPFPNGPNYSLMLTPVHLKEETTGHIRGTMPGMYYIPHARPYSDLAVFENVVNYAGRKFLLVDGGYQNSPAAPARLAYDITGPWER